MNNLICQIKGHDGSQIIAAYIDKQCKKLCCWKCIAEFHASHQKKCVEIDSIIAFIQQEINKQAHKPQQLNYGQKQIIQSLEQFSALIDSIQKIIKERIQKLKSQNLEEYLKKANKGQQGIQHQNQLLENILQYLEVDNNAIKLKISKEGQLNEIEKQEIKFIKQSGEAIQSMINQINQTQEKIDKPVQIKIEKLYFDEDRKSSTYSIIDKSSIKSINNFNFIQLQNQLIARWPLLMKDLIQEVRVIHLALIQKIVIGLLIGVGNDEGIKESSYINNNVGGGLGHGQYMLNSYSKYTLHHTDQEFDCKQKGFEFKTGDKIQIKYDHLTKMLEFRKQSDQDTVVRMPITDMTQILYPCVMLVNAGSQVQIVEY